MTEAQLLIFIEKLVPNLPETQMVLGQEIKKMSGLVNHKIVIDKLVELGLVNKTGMTYFILTQKGKELKQVKRFHKLKKYKKDKPKSKLKKIYMVITLVVFIYGIVTEIQNYNLKSNVETTQDSLQVMKRKSVQFSAKIDSLNRVLALQKETIQKDSALVK